MLFFSHPIEKQHDEIKKLPIDKQFDIYIYAVTNRHPPDFSFANDIASNGEKIIPFLIDKIKKEKNESIQQKIILIFEMMARYHYNLQDRNDLIYLLKEVISSMKFSHNIERSKKSLEIIMETK